MTSSIVYFVWYLEKGKRYETETLSVVDRVLNKHPDKKSCRNVLDPFLILVNNPEEPLHARNSFKNKIF